MVARPLTMDHAAYLAWLSFAKDCPEAFHEDVVWRELIKWLSPKQPGATDTTAAAAASSVTKRSQVVATLVANMIAATWKQQSEWPVEFVQGMRVDMRSWHVVCVSILTNQRTWTMRLLNDCGLTRQPMWSTYE